MSRSRVIRASTGLWLSFFVLAWVVLAPIRLGGDMVYLTTNGSSMVPHFHSGDLAVARRADGYEVGDIVAYTNPRVGTVLHRIVARDGDHFVLKGDNNESADSFEPAAADILGKHVFHIPGLGQTLSHLRNPLAIAVLAGLLGVVFATAITERSERRLRVRRLPAIRLPGLSGMPRSKTDGLLTAVIVLALFGVLLAFLSFRQPLLQNVARPVFYEQDGSFRYAAAAPAGVYDTDGATSGDPVFLRLARQIDVMFSYHFVTDTPHSVHGTYRLMEEVSQDNGWRRTAALVPATPFDGDSFTASVPVNLTDVQAVVDGVSAQTGVKNREARFAIFPVVELDGQNAGAAFSSSFSPRLEFKLDPLQLVLFRPGRAEQNPLLPVQSSVVPRFSPEQANLSLLGLHLRVITARWLSVTSLLVAVVGALIVASMYLLAGERDEAARIADRYAPLLLDVSGGEVITDVSIVNLLRFESLVKVAERDGRMILHREEGSVHHYLVTDGQLAYRYTTSSQAAGRGVLVEA